MISITEISWSAQCVRTQNIGRQIQRNVPSGEATRCTRNAISARISTKCAAAEWIAIGYDFKV